MNRADFFSAVSQRLSIVHVPGLSLYATSPLKSRLTGYTASQTTSRLQIFELFSSCLPLHQEAGTNWADYQAVSPRYILLIHLSGILPTLPSWVIPDVHRLLIPSKAVRDRSLPFAFPASRANVRDIFLERFGPVRIVDRCGCR